MNERIQELMKQSMVEYQFDLRFSPEKFAELIVAECVQVSLKSSHRNDDMGAIIAKNIQQHFGVNK